MITALAELGKTQRIQIIPEYDDAGNVTVTVLLAPKKPDGPTIRPLQYEGPIAEVEAHIGGGLDADVKKVVSLQSNLSDLEAEYEKAKKEKQAAIEEEKKAAKKKDEKPKAETKTEAKPAPAKEVKPGYRKKEAKVEAKTPEPAAPEAEVAAAGDDLAAELGDLFPESTPNEEAK